jgi:cell wall-associated NlpC family hydrolase
VTLDAIAAIQARIASIQSRFDGNAATATAASAASSGSTPSWASAASGSSFADMLAALQTSNASDATGDGSSTPSLDSLSSLLGQNSTSGLGNLGSLGGLGNAGSLGSAGGLSGLTGLAGLTGANTPTPSITANAAAFVDTALEQAGKKYVFGATVAPTDTNPKAFDCSELVQWAAERNGVQLPRTAGQQYATLAAQGDAISVDQALRTPGALLFSFSSTPTVGGAEPGHAHVAISLGDGRTIEARGRAYGVGVFEAGNRFQYAAAVPGL